MIKLIALVFEGVYWFLIFLSPVLLFATISVILYVSDDENIGLAILILLAGIVLGIFWAERIRRTKGCSAFMGRILATPDIWPIPVDKLNTTDLAAKFLFQCKANYYQKITPANRDLKASLGYDAMVNIAQSYISQGKATELTGFFQESQYFVPLWAAHLLVEYGSPDQETKEQALEIIKQYAANSPNPDVAKEEQEWLKSADVSL